MEDEDEKSTEVDTYTRTCSNVPPASYTKPEYSFTDSSFRCQIRSGKPIKRHFLTDENSFAAVAEIGSTANFQAAWVSASTRWYDIDYLGSTVDIKHEPIDNVSSAAMAAHDNRSYVKYVDSVNPENQRAPGRTTCSYPPGYPQRGYTDCDIRIYGSIMDGATETKVIWDLSTGSSIPDNSTSLVMVLVHEMGHVLSLKDGGTTGSVMKKAVSTGQPASAPTSDDAAAVRFIYTL